MNSEKMSKKIVIVTRSMASGGAERVIAQLANYFVNDNIICEIITTESLKVEYKLDPRIKLDDIGRQSNNKVNDRIKRYHILRKKIISEQPDVVLTMPEDTGIYVILSLIGTHIPVYVSERNNPWVMPDVKITRLLRKVSYPFAKGIIFQTKMAQSFFHKSIQKKSVVLSNPVDASRIPEPYVGERRKVIAAVGRLAPQKNFDLLIDAFKNFYDLHSDYRLNIYGEGPLRDHIQEKIDNYGLHDIAVLKGHSSHVLDEIREDTMFVLSSDYEGMPNALIEAMCMGMPVISTDCPSGGPRELIENGINGILVPVNDKKELSNGMSRLIETDLNDRLGKEAYNLRKILTDKQVFTNWEKYLFNE